MTSAQLFLPAVSRVSRAAVVACLRRRTRYLPYPDLVDAGWTAVNALDVARRLGPDREAAARASTVSLARYGGYCEMRLCGSTAPTVGDVVTELGLGELVGVP
jgi:hypothetical protein